MDRVEPQSANDYDDRTTLAVKSVLIEIGQILGSFEGKFANSSWRTSISPGASPRAADVRRPWGGCHALQCVGGCRRHAVA